MKVVGQSITVQQVPYAHVGYLAAATLPDVERPAVASVGVSVTLLVMAVLGLLGVAASGIGGVRRGGGGRRAWLAVLVACLLVFAVATATFAYIETRDHRAMANYHLDRESRHPTLAEPPPAAPPRPDAVPSEPPAGSEVPSPEKARPVE